jgi:F0F1-type ATP synthase assembly protein I
MGFDYKKNRVWAENLSIVMQLGLTMAGCIVLCFFIGRYIDQWLGTRGIFITVFTIFGVIGGANVAYRQILDLTTNRDNQKKSSNHLNHGSD